MVLDEFFYVTTASNSSPYIIKFVIVTRSSEIESLIGEKTIYKILEIEQFKYFFHIITQHSIE